MSFSAGGNTYLSDINANIRRAYDVERVKAETMKMGYNQLIQDRIDQLEGQIDDLQDALGSGSGAGAGAGYFIFP